MDAIKPVEVMIGGKKRTLIFDLNTFSAFEKVSGRFFMDFLADLRDAFKEGQAKNEPFEVLRRISASNILALLWAAMHEYDEDDNPVWPMTLSKLGRVVDISAMAKLLPSIMQGNTDSAPDAPAEAKEELRPTNGGQSTPVNGGLESIPSREDALAALEKVLDS